MGERKNLVFPIAGPNGSDVWPKRQWLWSADRVRRAIDKNELEFVRSKDGWTVHTKQYWKDESGKTRPSKAFSLIDDVYTQHGTNEIISVLGDIQVFPYPKPTGLLKQLFQISTEPEGGDIVLDFFAGSCTTADAVLQLNREDGGNRRFTLVQLPEPTPNGSVASKTGYQTSAEIGKERIRRVIARMHQEQEGKLDLHDRDQPEDLGFRVYKLGRSQLKRWQPYPGESTQEVQARFAQFESPLVESWDPEALRVEVMLQEGLPLDSSVERLGEVGGNTVDCVTSDWCEHRLFLCFDEVLGEETVERLPELMGDQDILVCLDSALTDESKMQLDDRCNVHVI